MRRESKQMSEYIHAMGWLSEESVSERWINTGVGGVHERADLKVGQVRNWKTVSEKEKVKLLKEGDAKKDTKSSEWVSE